MQRVHQVQPLDSYLACVGVCALQTMRGLSLPVYHERFDSPLTAEALYERIKFSQGQKIPLPAAHGAARLYNDVTQEEMDAALVLWKEMCA